MTPVYQILADSKDITDAVAVRLISLSVSDEAGIESDAVEIVLDDRDGGLALPRTGAVLDVRLGYRETGLHPLGRYVVDEIVLNGPPAVMTIRGRSADLKKGLKAPRTRSWDGVTIGGIVTTIAREHGYTPRVSADLAAAPIDHIDQVDESDLHFLTRLAGARGAVAKPAGGVLLFVPAGEAKSATGKKLPEVSLPAEQLGSYDVVIAERGKYASVKARWHDQASATEQFVTAGNGEPQHTIGRRYPDRDAAVSAAKARLAAFERGSATVRLTCPGDTRLMAEGRVTISGQRTGVDACWNITRVTHRYDAGGYACDIEGESEKEK